MAMLMDGVLKLYFGESNFPTPEYIKQSAKEALAAIQAGADAVLLDNMALDEMKKAVELAVRAIATAIERDAATGNSILVSVIDKDGYQEVSKDEILKIWKKP
jgi:20S proteasome alpha/beta subunit